MSRWIVLSLLVVSSLAFAQHLRDFRNAGVEAQSTVYNGLPDGGATISSCGFARSVNSSPDGGRYVLTHCTEQHIGRTAAQRNALAQCLDNGERVLALELNVRTDAGF